MRQIERIADFTEALNIALDGLAARLWSALPGTIESYDPVKGTCKVQPTIQGRFRSPDGTHTLVNLPVLPDVPVVYIGGGDFVATFPIAPGNECLVIFADRCIDGWWEKGGIQAPLEPRMHDLSDGFAIVGPRSLPNAIPNVSTNSAQLRSRDGSTYVEIAGGQIVNVVAPQGVNINGLSIDSSGNLTTPGKVTAQGEVTAAGVQLSQHVHPGVQAGGASTGKPLA